MEREQPSSRNEARDLASHNHSDVSPSFAADKDFPWTFVELCAGSGILSSFAKQAGMKVVAVDCERNRHQPFTDITAMDLTDDSCYARLGELAQQRDVLCWHIGLPCGTCSRAREIRLKPGSWGPPPLRGEGYEYGFPWNKPADKEKVDQASMLVWFRLLCSS